jgi:endonuclease-3 related protein
MKIYNALYEAYGPQHWWPGDSPWEICVGAVLTQNTNWGNVEMAIANLKKNKRLDAQKILDAPDSGLEDDLRPSGYFRVKSVRLRNVSRWWLDNVTPDSKLKGPEKPQAFWRESILSVNGVGPETADSILLYSFGLPVFVIDAYTKRIMARHFGFDPDIEYHELQKFFTDRLPSSAELYNEFHALFVRAAKERCRKNTCLPGCPLNF